MLEPGQHFRLTNHHQTWQMWTLYLTYSVYLEAGLNKHPVLWISILFNHHISYLESGCPRVATMICITIQRRRIQKYVRVSIKTCVYMIHSTLSNIYIDILRSFFIDLLTKDTQLLTKDSPYLALESGEWDVVRERKVWPNNCRLDCHVVNCHVSNLAAIYG